MYNPKQVYTSILYPLILTASCQPSLKNSSFIFTLATEWQKNQVSTGCDFLSACLQKSLQFLIILLKRMVRLLKYNKKAVFSEKIVKSCFGGAVDNFLGKGGFWRQKFT